MTKFASTEKKQRSQKEQDRSLTFWFKTKKHIETTQQFNKLCFAPHQNDFRDCVFDLCELDGVKHILCEAIEAYVNECQDRGVVIGSWRNETFCRECWVNECTEKYLADEEMHAG